MNIIVVKEKKREGICVDTLLWNWHYLRKSPCSQSIPSRPLPFFPSFPSPSPLNLSTIPSTVAGSTLGDRKYCYMDLVLGEYACAMNIKASDWGPHEQKKETLILQRMSKSAGAMPWQLAV